jgi:L-asparaginase / beta-aspartyl-peptidase
VSATGHGEYFIRATVAHEIASLIRYAGKNVGDAADIVVHEQLRRMGGEGGVIVVGRDGTLALPFNSRGMLRGSIDASGRMTTGVL